MRSSLVVFCVVSCLALQSFAQIPQILNSIRNRTLKATEVKPVAEACAEGDKGIWKCKDCETIQFCSGSTPDFSMPCRAQSPSKPYCYVNKELTSIADKCVSDAKVCTGAPSDFTCPGEGIYPSLTDCRSYYTCTKKDKLIATKYMCLYNTVYNHAQKFCKFGFPCHDVVTECANQYKVIPYKNDNNLYVFCMPDNPPLLKQCAEGSTFNTTTLGCGFSCQSEGIFVDPEDKLKKFYRCFNDGKVLRKESETCPDKYIFDAEKKYCVNDPNSPIESGTGSK